MEQIILEIQKYLENNPLLLIGSGLSASYGLPTMVDLKNEIIRNINKFSDDEVTRALLEDLNKNIDLETAIGANNQIPNEDYKKIKEIVWSLINKKDQELFLNIINDNIDMSLTELFRKQLNTASKTINIITTNYDRVIEYAADIVNATINTGFVGQYIKYFRRLSTEYISKNKPLKDKTINLCKVHGSLDWIRKGNDFCSISNLTRIPNGYEPNIITPGPQKYLEAYDEPYREIIQKADNLINDANCFLAIGYGFNDLHVQPKIIKEIKNGKPIVIITKEATEQCIKILNENKNIKYILIEEKNGKSKITVNGKEKIVNGNLWKLEEFLKIW